MSAFMYMHTAILPRLGLCTGLSNNYAIVQYLGFVPTNKPIVGFELHLEEKSYYSIFKDHFELDTLYPVSLI